MKSRVLKILFAPFPNPFKLLYRPTFGLGLIRQTLHRPTPSASEIFANACKKHNVSDDRLQTEIIPALRRRRRMATILGWINIGLFGVGLVTQNINMFVIAVLAAIVCFGDAFRYQFHGWQSQRRELAGIYEFLADRPAFFQIFLW